MSQRHIGIVFASMGIGCLASSSALAGTWVGGDGDWNTPSNWNPAFVPGTNPTVNVNEDFDINNGSEVTVSSDPVGDYLNWRDLRLHVTGATAGSTITVDDSVTLRIKREFQVGMGATVNINGGTVIQGTGGSFGRADSPASRTLGPTIVNMTGGSYTSSGNSVGTNGGYAEVYLSGGNWSTGANGSMHLGAGALHETLVGNTSTVTQSGGTMLHNRGIFIGGGHTGVYNLTNGTVTQTSGDGDKEVRIGIGASGTMNIVGGQANLTRTQVGPSNVYGGPTGNGNGVGLLHITGGSYTGWGLAVGGSDNIGSGTLRVTGSQGSISLNRPNAKPIESFANGTLNFQIDATGVSTIVANGSSTDGRSLINLSGTLDLDLIGGFVPSEGQAFTLLTTNNVASYFEVGNPANVFGRGIVIDAHSYQANNVPSYTTTGLSLAAADEASWTFGVVELDENAGHALVATYVPEPGSLALLGLAVPALLRRMRRA